MEGRRVDSGGITTKEVHKKNDIADVFHQGNLLLFVYPTYHYYYSWRDVYELDLYLYGAMLD